MPDDRSVSIVRVPTPAAAIGECLRRSYTPPPADLEDMEALMRRLAHYPYARARPRS